MLILDKPALSHADRAEAGDGNQGDLCISNHVSNGLLPLAFVLSCAGDVAGILRELHSAGRCHGAVAECLVLAPHGATLVPPREFPEMVDQGLDVRAFGSLLYEMVTGLKPSEETGGIESAPMATFQGPEGVRLAAIRLALRCLETSDGRRPNMQQVLTELRLFHVLARQWEPAPAVESPQPASAVRSAPAPIMFVPESFGLDVDDAATLRKPSRVRCPHCSGPFVYFSLPKTWFERMLGSMGIHLHRCHRCLYRFGVLLGIVFSKID